MVQMASLKPVFCLGLYLSVWISTKADSTSPKAENVRWVSLDFKTILVWTTPPSSHTYTVLYSWNDNDWLESPDCIRLSESECDLTNKLESYDRSVSADIKTEPASMDYDYDQDELPHTYSPTFNPYKYSNISAVEFTVAAVDKSRVRVNITDPLTSIHKSGKQLSIRDVFRNDLKYKISYWKSGSTGKRDTISDSSIAEVPELDPGTGYCFMVAAYIPSRPRSSQYGAWSRQQCTDGDLTELSVGAWVGVVFSLLAGTVIIITVIVVCCKQRTKHSHTSSSQHI
ncbi:tissue factor-like isoform X2 [Betta splendens]|uniref:Tissue factor n=1 Tax=Betta splendens TaxID=158456 RepID=A0A6P7L5C9_BETSP|nr:tissue factor-like isoform X2 [Betta splendens]